MLTNYNDKKRKSPNPRSSSWFMASGCNVQSHRNGSCTPTIITLSQLLTIEKSRVRLAPEGHIQFFEFFFSGQKSYLNLILYGLPSTDIKGLL